MSDSEKSPKGSGSANEAHEANDTKDVEVAPQQDLITDLPPDPDAHLSDEEKAAAVSATNQNSA